MNCSSHKFGKREMEEALHSKRLKYCSLNKGWISQAVGMTTEDDIVQESIETALEEQVVVHTDDERNAQFADPNEFLVPNTSCASCHKLNHIRFAMHNLSSLEDRAITVSTCETRCFV